ncbi:POT-type proton-dependent oligopeptide transporter [Candidatus Coxiella mudrowiae]|uniref:POT-type proton-dependent oligopeptide transporter n=1 Tax=Candidatus Coxiella mudrowiae TaxID=2054173 RepID=UPI0006623821|nr:hypothetical protein [Candidatus Coxiella mudrowiae]
MVIGMITFLIGRKRLGNRDLPTQSPLNSFSAKIKFNTVLCLRIIASVALIKLCFDFPASTNTIVVIGTFLIFLAVVYFLLKEKRAQRNKMTANLILIAISISFWALYNQTFSSLMLLR